VLVPAAVVAAAAVVVVACGRVPVVRAEAEAQPVVVIALPTDEDIPLPHLPDVKSHPDEALPQDVKSHPEEARLDAISPHRIEVVLNPLEDECLLHTPKCAAATTIEEKRLLATEETLTIVRDPTDRGDIGNEFLPRNPEDHPLRLESLRQLQQLEIPLRFKH